MCFPPTARPLVSEGRFERVEGVAYVLRHLRSLRIGFVSCARGVAVYISKRGEKFDVGSSRQNHCRFMEVPTAELSSKNSRLKQTAKSRPVSRTGGLQGGGNDGLRGSGEDCGVVRNATQ